MYEFLLQISKFNVRFTLGVEPTLYGMIRYYYTLVPKTKVHVDAMSSFFIVSMFV